MAVATQTGYLVLADISGFTSFLAQSELEHAHDILRELLEVIVGRLTPVLAVAKLEGDAVFAYAPTQTLARGETLVELIEATYVAFRDRVEAVRRGTTCDCNACRSVPMLDLKFVAHHGAYLVQQIAGGQDLLGSDVNLTHRLLKNTVTEKTGWRGYALFTGPCLERMGVTSESMHSQNEQYEHLGEITVHCLNLHPRYGETKEARRRFLTAEEATETLGHVFRAPAPVLWTWLNDPHLRSRWSHNRFQPIVRPGGRTAAGARNHCLHGKDVIVEDVVDWRPFDYFTVDYSKPGKAVAMTMTSQLEPVPEGTRLRLHARVFMRPALFAKLYCRMMMKQLRRQYAELDRLLAESAPAEGATPPRSEGDHARRPHRPGTC